MTILQQRDHLLRAAKGVAARCCGEYPGHPETEALLLAIEEAEQPRDMRCPFCLELYAEIPPTVNRPHPVSHECKHDQGEHLQIRQTEALESIAMYCERLTERA